jgi:hypothetical protein
LSHKNIIEQHKVHQKKPRTTVPAHLWWSSLELWWPGLCHWTNYIYVIVFICNKQHFVINLHMVLSPSCTCGTCSYLSVTLAIRHKVSARSFLQLMCTCGTLVHPTCTCGTYSYSSVTLVIRHKSPFSPFCIRRVHVGPFSIRPMGHEGLHVTCTCGTFLHLHPTYGTRRLACHLYHVCSWDLISQKKDLIPRSQT